MSTAPRYIPRYTAEQYATWEGRWELLDGLAVAMTPSPFGPHAEWLSRLAALFWNAIDAAGCRATVLVEIDWIVANDTVLRPDVIVVCGPAPETHVLATPAVVVEILSAATRDRDLTVKRDIYEARGVRWYLIVDPDGDATTILRLGVDDRYKSLSGAGPQSIDLCADCTISLDLSGI
jgi:Uma2 family endonuclease